ncbi:MAG: RNA polymerase sigma-70 factor [Ginsengibacter sp.]
MEDLFKKYFHSNYERLHSYAFTIVKDNEEAEDIVQLAFVKLWEKRSRVNIEQSGKFYLYKSVYHLCLNSIRDKKTKQKYEDKLALPSAGTSYLNEDREINNQVSAAIDTLPVKCREVFIKSRDEGKRYAEIAMELNISVKTVEAQMGKALKILRNLLTDLIKT